MKDKKYKNKISSKLTLCFTIAILLFAIVIGTIFTVLFRDYTESLYQENMKKTARSISTVITSLIKDGGTGSLWEAFSERRGDNTFPQGPINRKPDGAVYIDGPRLIRFVKEITDAEVWVIDSKNTILTTSKESETEYSAKFVFDKMSEEAKQFIYKVFEGEGYEVCGESFSSLLGEEYMSVGVPVYTIKGEVTGAVLVHTPESEMMEEIGSGMFILLISIVLAFLIGLFISVMISRTIAKPLKRINNAALLISEGDYTVKTNVKGNDEIGELAHTMDEMGEKLHRAEIESDKLQQMRQDFVANISHELRTPVTVIRGSLEALCDKVVTEPEMVAEYHRQLLGESIYMQRLVNDLLDLSRLQNPDFSINITEFNLCDCISDSVRSGRRIASEKGINIGFESDTSVYMFKGDYDRVRQMLLIIIDNAIKFTDNPENSVTVSFASGEVTITNVGQGIKAEDLPVIFERFYKSRSEKNKNGTGLGLAIAKQIASRHQVGISVSSTEGGETTFRFVFPQEI